MGRHDGKLRDKHRSKLGVPHASRKACIYQLGTSMGWHCDVHLDRVGCWASNRRYIDGFGFMNWLLSPELGVHMGLKYASATVPLFPPGEISMRWEIS